MRPVSHQFRPYRWALSTAEIARRAGIAPGDVLRFDGNTAPDPPPTARPETIAIALRGVRNVLVNAGIVGGAVEKRKSTRLDMPDGTCYVTCEQAGLIEFCIELGASVRRGDRIARVWDVEHSGRPPVDYEAGRDGIFVGRHFPGLVQSGDTIAVVAVRAD